VKNLKSITLVAVNAGMLSVCLAPLLLSSGAENQEVGPMLGDVTHHSAKLWVYAEPGDKLDMKITPEGKTTVKFEQSKYSNSSISFS
jgi:hypothetical protein